MTDWRCTAILPNGKRCANPARLGLHHGPKLCKQHAFPAHQPATEPLEHQRDPQDGHDAHHAD